MRAVPNPRRRLNDGVLIQASVLARVLGVRLLTVDTTVILVPAEVQVPAARGAPVSVRPPKLAPTPTPVRAAARRSGTAGRGLADAVRSVNEGAELLALSRRNGT